MPVLLNDCCPAVQYAVQLSFLMGKGAAIGFGRSHELWTAFADEPRSIRFQPIWQPDGDQEEPEEVEWFPCDPRGNGVWMSFLLGNAPPELKVVYRTARTEGLFLPLTFYAQTEEDRHHWAYIQETQQVYYCTAGRYCWRPCYPPHGLNWSVLPPKVPTEGSTALAPPRFRSWPFSLLPTMSRRRSCR